MNDGRVSFEVDSGVAAVTLRRPKKLNALTLEMIIELERLITQLELRTDVKVLTLSGEGDAFSVGADLAQFGDETRESTRNRWIKTGHRSINRLATFPKPTVAVVNGPAFGGGLELALACDLRIAADSARLGQPEVSVGTTPGWGGTQRLIAAVGAARTRELILTGRSIDAGTAYQWGLVNDVAAAPVLGELRDRYVTDLVSQAPIAQELAKAVINALTGTVSQVEALESLAGSLTATTSDLQNGIRAFHSKQPREFKGE